MWNSAGYGTRDLIDRFIAYLRTVIPVGTTNRLDPPTFPNDGTWDARLRWTIGTRPVELGLEVRLAADAIDLDRLPVAGQDVAPVLISTFIPRRTQELLEQAGWSYWDPTGNALIRLMKPVVLLRQQGATKDPDPQVKPAVRLRSLKGEAASQVMVALLRNDGFATSIRDFARENALQPSTVSRVVSLLRDENFLMPTGLGSFLIEDRLAAAQRWAEDYSFETTFHAKRYFSLSGRDLALQRIGQSGVHYAITGVAAANERLSGHGQAASLPATELWVYTTDLAALERAADLAPDRRQGDIRVAECDFLNRDEPTSTVDGLCYVTPWRIVGDLLSAGGRRAGIGEELARDLIESRRVADV